MELQDKHKLTLLNAKCEIVCKVDTILKKMKYGEDVSCCLEDLWLAIKLINRLDCYCFPSIDTITTTNQGTLQFIQNRIDTIADGDYYLAIGGVLVYKETATSNTMSELVKLLLDGYGITNSRTVINETSDRYTFKNNCDNLEYEVYFNASSILETSILISPVCEVTYTTCHNCIEDSDLPKMYEVLSELLK